METDNTKREQPQPEDTENKPEEGIGSLLWIKENCRSVEQIIYPDGSRGDLEGNFMVII